MPPVPGWPFKDTYDETLHIAGAGMLVCALPGCAPAGHAAARAPACDEWARRSAVVDAARRRAGVEKNMICLPTLLEALAPFAWPLSIGVLFLVYRTRIGLLADAAVARVQGGDSLTIGMITLGQATGPLKAPVSGQGLSDDHLALVHRSWRAPAHDARFGQEMHRIHVIVFGTADALRRVEYVVYRLDKAFPSPIRMGGPPESNFALNELANGYSLIRADVYVRGQSEPVRLSRLVDLTDKSEPLKGSAYLPARAENAMEPSD